jgi:hypothetical protein
VNGHPMIQRKSLPSASYSPPILGGVGVVMTSSQNLQLTQFGGVFYRGSWTLMLIRLNRPWLSKAVMS